MIGAIAPAADVLGPDRGRWAAAVDGAVSNEAETGCSAKRTDWSCRRRVRARREILQPQQHIISAAIHERSPRTTHIKPARPALGHPRDAALGTPPEPLPPMVAGFRPTGSAPRVLFYPFCPLNFVESLGFPWPATVAPPQNHRSLGTGPARAPGPVASHVSRPHTRAAALDRLRDRPLLSRSALGTQEHRVLRRFDT